MNINKMKKRIIIIILGFTINSFAQSTFNVTLDQPQHGTYTVSPEIPANGKVKAGTVLTIQSKADKGYVFDTNYRTGKGPWQPYYYEQTKPKVQFTVNEDMHIGASFVPQSWVENLDETQDIVYAKPGVKPLKYDVYSPKGAKNLPCIVIIHGGGWHGNTEDVMRGLARELANSGKYVVFSIDYRWNEYYDGGKKPTKLYQIIDDVYGALAHISEHAKQYSADATKIFVTGDSAGGHLAAASIDFVERIGAGGFGKTAGIYEFMPTYLPKGKSAKQFKQEMLTAIKGAVPSYAVFAFSSLHRYLKEDEDAIRAVTPNLHIPNISQRAVPQLLFRGSEDGLITNDEVTSYLDAMVKAGQRVDYVQVGGANHAFFDWKPDAQTQATFAQYGKYHAQEMLHFFDSVLEAGK